MKKLLILSMLLTACIMAAGFALSESEYDFSWDSTDGSDAIIYPIIDLLNDETTLVDEYGSIHIQMDLVDADEVAVLSMSETLTNTDFGPAIIVEVDGAYIFVTASHYISMIGKEVASQSAAEAMGDSFDFEAYWGNMYYPYASDEMLIAGGQGEDGIMTLRTRGYDNGIEGEFEYTLGENMRLLQTLVYHYDEDKSPKLQMIITYSTGDAITLPDEIIAELSLKK